MSVLLTGELPFIPTLPGADVPDEQPMCDNDGIHSISFTQTITHTHHGVILLRYSTLLEDKPHPTPTNQSTDL